MVMSLPDAGAERPEVLIELRMFSTDVAERDVQLSHASTKQLFAGVPVQPSNRPAGKSTMLVQDCQHLQKVVAATNEIEGNAVRLLQLYQAPPFAPPKTWQLERSSAGNEVKPVQSDHAPLIGLLSAAATTTDEVSISGKLVRPAQLPQAPSMFVADEKSRSGNTVKPEHEFHVDSKIVPFDVSITGKLVKLEQNNHALAKLTPLEVLIEGKLARLEHPCHAP